MSDYIDKSDAINLLWLYADESCASVVSDFENLPAADVAPVRHGRWIFDHMTGEWSYYSCCSECGHQDFFANDSVEKKYKYCYSCGALMDGKEDNT